MKGTIRFIGLRPSPAGIGTGSFRNTGDFNGDGTVDLSNLGILAGKYGSTTPVIGLGDGIPEPATLAMLALGGLAMVRRRIAR